MPRLRLEPIKVSNKFLNPSKLRRSIDNFLDAAAEDIRIDFGVATQTWRNKPDFDILARPWNERQVYTVSLVNGKPIFKFVSGGTRVRYATMSPDWVSKTSPNVLGSGPGQGRMLFVSKKHPRPGIKARNFAHLIVVKWNPRWPSLFVRIISDELNR